MTSIVFSAAHSYAACKYFFHEEEAIKSSVRSDALFPFLVIVFFQVECGISRLKDINFF